MLQAILRTFLRSPRLPGAIDPSGPITCYARCYQRWKALAKSIDESILRTFLRTALLPAAIDPSGHAVLSHVTHFAVVLPAWRRKARAIDQPAARRPATAAGRCARRRRTRPPLWKLAVRSAASPDRTWVRARSSVEVLYLNPYKIGTACRCRKPKLRAVKYV